MIKTLQKHGNSQALVIEKTLIEAMGITPETPLQVTLSGSTLIITPVNVGMGREAAAAFVQKIRPKYGQMLKKLAE